VNSDLDLKTSFEKLIKGICRHPDDCLVRWEESPERISMFVEPHKADMRLLIGAGGRTVRALKYLFELAAASEPCRTGELLVEQGFRGEVEPHGEFVQNPEFDVDEFMDFFSDFVILTLRDRTAYCYERKNDLLEIYVTVDAEDEATVHALSDAFYPWGYRHGITIKVKVSKPKPAGKR
jgi:predicted RNA-binding protein YlqC (UPF0109 family)